MTTDPKPTPDTPEEWRGDFQAAEARQLAHWASATPSERLKWLEEALAFAYRMGALPTKRH